MSIDPEARVQEFKSGLESDLASVESDIASRKSELDRLERERDELQRLNEEADRLLSTIRKGNRLPQAVVRVPQKSEHRAADSAPSHESTSTTNGLPENPTRRQLVLKIVPSFHGKRFTAGDIRHRIVQDYMDGEEPPNFPQAINNLLKRMAAKGEIKGLGRSSDLPGEPYVYEENESHEGTLNLGP